MTTPRAVLAGLALIAAAIFFQGSARTANQATGTFLAVPVPSGNMWKIDTSSGMVSWCTGVAITDVPTCSPWSHQ